MSCWSFSNRDVLLLIYIFWNTWEGLLCKVVICILEDTCYFFNYLCWEKLYSIWSRTSLIVYAFEKNMWWVDTFSAVIISTFLSWSWEMLCWFPEKINPMYDCCEKILRGWDVYIMLIWWFFFYCFNWATVSHCLLTKILISHSCWGPLRMFLVIYFKMEWSISICLGLGIVCSWPRTTNVLNWSYWATMERVRISWKRTCTLLLYLSRGWLYFWSRTTSPIENFWKKTILVEVIYIMGINCYLSIYA